VQLVPEPGDARLASPQPRLDQRRSPRGIRRGRASIDRLRNLPDAVPGSLDAVALLLAGMQSHGVPRAEGSAMTWREERLAEIDKRARQFRRELETDWVRAVADFNGYRPSGGAFSIKRGTLVSRGSFAVEKYPAAFARLDERSIESRVRSWIHRLRVAWGVE
jgi:hypothetical protein